LIGNELKVHNNFAMKRVTRNRSSAPAVHLPNLFAFEVVARRLNFARSAEELEVSPTAMSKTIRQLEARLGVRLFNRTTRSVALTEAGTHLLISIGPALAQIRNSVEQINAASTRPAGLLRLNTSYVAYAALIEPHVRQFLERYPEITLDVQIDNGLSDIVGGGFDAGIRLGEALQRDMIAIRMGPLQQLVVVGSPRYLAARGIPKTPKDLLQHECIRQRLAPGGRLLDWEFNVAGKLVTIGVEGPLLFNEMHSVMTAARQGCGLAYVFRQFAEAEIRRGRLTVVLERYSRPREAFHLYYAGRAQLPGKLRALIDFVRTANWEVLD
jgi:DNA-binding transcriptional LysR family regulator